MNRLKLKKLFLKLKLRAYLLKIWLEEEVKNTPKRKYKKKELLKKEVQLILLK